MPRCAIKGNLHATKENLARRRKHWRKIAEEIQLSDREKPSSCDPTHGGPSSVANNSAYQLPDK
jgi:hypothetical protein